MDAFTRLCLMAKAKRVFESAGTFLSFPVLSARTYRPEQLKFGRPGEVTPQILADHSEFARMTADIPRGVLAPVGQDDYLWDVYEEVLSTAQIAQSALSEAERARYDRAWKFLYTRSVDGLRRDSDALRGYKQHRDAHITALEEYKNQQLTAESSQDTAVQTKWRNEDEPRLRTAVTNLEGQWLTQGMKAEVEAELQVEQAFAARQPSLAWDEWKASFITELDTQTDTNVINYAVTGFTPYNFYDDDNWPRFTLTREEMTRLAGDAPAELRQSLGDSQPDPDLDRVSFEYRSVAVTRGWFRPAVFKSRSWRLPAGAEPLSDGGDPAQGRCPSYITAIVFARNLRVERRPAGLPKPPEELRTMLLLNATMLHVAATPPRAETPPPRHRHLDPSLRRSAVRPGFAGAPARLAETMHLRRSVRNLEAFNFSVMAQPASLPVATPPTPPAAPAPVADTSEMIVLAFICKRLGLCPDPDPALSWP